jgi:hypothetical protein
MLEIASVFFLRIKVMKIRFYTLTYSDLIFNDNLCVCYQAFVQTGFNKSPAITGEGGKVQMRTVSSAAVIHEKILYVEASLQAYPLLGVNENLTNTQCKP